jgi:hypothetical protein
MGGMGERRKRRKEAKEKNMKDEFLSEPEAAPAAA